jgi:threonine synthase
MWFISTRGGSAVPNISQAMRNGAAPDGGLYVPESMVPMERLPADLPLARLGALLLRPFFQDDVLQDQLDEICSEAFDCPVPLVTPDPARPGLSALELFHGPTGAFKDFGARFLIACLDRLADPARPLKLLAATSGDTGGAVGCAAEGRTGVAAYILYPKGRVSPFQQLQLSCWEAPVQALEVNGDFDDCQRLVKEAFADRKLSDDHNLTSANSINLGRLLPQMVYLSAAALELFEKTGVKPGFIIPTGNLGHGFAALLARRLGVPIGPVIAATNANRALFDWRRGGAYQPALSVRTIANAMDVGAPSNFERLAKLPHPRGEIEVERVTDAAIRRRIEQDHSKSGYVWCPHSATAAEAYERLDSARRAERPWVVAATAHPFKFAGIVEPLIGARLSPPPALAAVMGRGSQATPIAATLDALAGALSRPAQAAPQGVAA